MNVRAANIAAIRVGMSPVSRPRRGRNPLPTDEATPGGRLRALRDGAKVGQEELAADIGVTRPMISKYESNAHAMPDYVVERIAQRFGVTAAFIRYGDVSSRMAPVVGFVGAGARVEAVEQAPSRFVEVPASWGDAGALEIQGLSCYPIYEEGDIIVIRGEQRLVEGEILGKMCVVETADGVGLVKRVRRGATPGCYDLESPNAPTLEDVPLASARPVRLHVPK